MAFSRLHTLKLIKQIQEVAALHYEPGRQDRNYYAVWKYHIFPVFHINYITFLRYMKVNVAAEMGRLENI